MSNKDDAGVMFWPGDKGLGTPEFREAQEKMRKMHRRSGKTAMVSIKTAPTPETREIMRRVFEDDTT
ncbi:MAG: hypothetical protein ACR2RF_18765 [Geminicoccaceae bacterium]